MSYRKPALWVMLLSIILCVALALCFLTDPKAAGVNPSANVSGDTTKVTVTEPTTPFTNTPATTVPAGDSRPSTTQTTTVSTSESASSSATETATTETESDKSDVDNTKTDTTTTTTTITTTTTTTAVSTTTSQTVVIDKNAFDKVIDGVYTAPNGGFQIDVPGWKLFNMYSVKLVPETYRMYGSTNCIIVNVHETLPRSQFENMNSSDFANMLNTDIDSLEKRKIECASGSYTCYRAEIDDSADYGTICDLWMFQTENARYVLIFCQDIGESDMSPVAEKIMSSIRIYY